MVAGKVLSPGKMASETPHTSLGKAFGQPSEDRRKRRRFPAQWRVELSGTAHPPIHARTVDVSSCGFYCRSPRALLPGERLTALLEIAEACGRDGSPALVLRCDVHVLRVDAVVQDDSWGIACEILDYSVCRKENETSSDGKY